MDVQAKSMVFQGRTTAHDLLGMITLQRLASVALPAITVPVYIMVHHAIAVFNHPKEKTNQVAASYHQEKHVEGNISAPEIVKDRFETVGICLA